MRWVKRKKIQRYLAIFFFAALVSPSLFLFSQNVRAEGDDIISGPGSQAVTSTVTTQTNQNTNSPGASPASSTSTDGGFFGWMGSALKGTVIWLLLQLRNLIYLVVASPAAGAFAWVLDPNNISGPTGVMNLPAIYTLWQFIRDFFNLFFILILLFSAFATIFQVDSFNIRNIFKNILLVALLINFSFPITRFLIDATNVPMYYFVNDVIGNGTGRGGLTVMESLLGYSGISAGTMASIGENNDLVPVLMSIIFAFLFAISLAVLSVMMIIRLVALTLLLIFSPIGFASSLLPGLNRYGQEWWSKFWSYALFGPAAGLMLVVSLKFMEAVSSGSTWSSMNQVATGISPGPGQANLITQVIFFIIPIMLIWFTIGLANKFSLAGAATVVGLGTWAPRKMQEYGKKAMWGATKFAGRRVVGTTKAVAKRVPILRSVPGAYAGVKEAVKGDGKLFGKQVIPKFVTGDAAKARQEAFEARNARTKGFVHEGRKGADDELRKLEAERVRKGVKEAQEKGVQAEKHLKTLKDSGASVIEKRVAALSLAQQGEIRTAGQLADALQAVNGNVDEFNQVLDKAKPSAIGSMDSDTNAKIINLLNATKKDKDGNDVSVYGSRQADLQQAYSGILKKENKSEYRVEAEIARRVSSGTGPASIEQIYRDVLKMGSKDLSKQSGLIQNARDGGSDPAARKHFQEMAKNQKDTFEKVLRSDELKPEDMKVLLEIKNSVGPQVQQTTQSPSGESVSQGGIVIPPSSKPRGENR